MPQREIILCTMGTQGDFEPFRAIAAGLVARGLPVTLIANENWRGRSLEIGADFEAIAPEDPAQNGRDDLRFFKTNVLKSFELSFDHIERRVSAGSKPLLVWRANMLGAECAAEKFGLTNLRIALQPSAIRSLDRPPWPWASWSSGARRWMFKSVILPTLLLAETAGRYRRVTNDFRRAVGLPSQGLQWLRHAGDMTLVLCPKWFSQPQPDWPRACLCLGFPLSEPGAHDPALDRFIDQHGRPIVFTAGTGVTKVAALAARAVETCQRLGRPGVFLSRHAPSPSSIGGHPFLHKDFADLGALLRRSLMMVHHGGIGTTAHALRAGIPQIVLPDRFDQPDNALRVASLGLGAAVYDRRANTRTLERLSAKMLDDKAMRERLRRASKAIQGDRAIARTVQLIEALP